MYTAFKEKAQFENGIYIGSRYQKVRELDTIKEVKRLIESGKNYLFTKPDGTLLKWDDLLPTNCQIA